MRRWLAFVSVAMLPSVAEAQLPGLPGLPEMQNSMSQTVGPFTYYNGTTPGGGSVNGSSQQIGPFTYSHFNGPNGQMTNCTTQQIGDFAHTSCQ